MQHAVEVSQFASKSIIDPLFKRASQFEALTPASYPKPLLGLTLATIFYEPSTRTRLSFETAIQNLGGQLISVENAGEYSSAKKGESLEDTIMTLNAYADGIVLRHPEVGSATNASKISKVPVFNAGDGAGEHPSQALLDIFTIQRAKGSIDGLHIALVGDLLNSRTIHSLLTLLKLYEITLYLISPPSLQLSQDHVALLKNKNVHFLENWDDIIGKVDVLYMTRIQKERFALIEDYFDVKDSFMLTMRHVNQMKADAIILHPLPRVNEIATEVDKDSRAHYFQQVSNGLHLRMALLEHIYTGGLATDER